MKKILSLKTVSVFFLLCSALTLNLFAQTEQPTTKKVNFGYSQNPKTKSQNQTGETAEQVKTSTEIASQSENPTNSPQNFESRSSASKTMEVARRANTAAISPTEIYKIGIGDVLFISLQNAPSKASTYYTVLKDGTIDYPLAGEMVEVAGLTAEEIEELLKNKIKLFENPQISVKVREHASHAINVLGLVEKPGEKYLQREAIPLFIIRAEAIVQPRANIAIIKRANSDTERINLKDSKSDSVLIFPGDIIEFKSDANDFSNAGTPQFYYIGGSIASAGQKDFYAGLTLTQAILASGGLKKSNAKKVIIRRKNEEGLLSPHEFNLQLIKDGKQPDPQIFAGDTIEIGN